MSPRSGSQSRHYRQGFWAHASATSLDSGVNRALSSRLPGASCGDAPRAAQGIFECEYWTSRVFAQRAAHHLLIDVLASSSCSRFIEICFPGRRVESWALQLSIPNCLRRFSRATPLRPAPHYLIGMLPRAYPFISSACMSVPAVCDISRSASLAGRPHHFGQ